MDSAGIGGRDRSATAHSYPMGGGQKRATRREPQKPVGVEGNGGKKERGQAMKFLFAWGCISVCVGIVGWIAGAAHVDAVICLTVGLTSFALGVVG